MHLAAGAPLVGDRVAGGAAPGGDGEVRDGLHALLRFVLALQRAQQRVQPLGLLILYCHLVPADACCFCISFRLVWCTAWRILPLL